MGWLRAVSSFAAMLRLIQSKLRNQLEIRDVGLRYSIVSRWVNTIITEATPHLRPVINIDKKMTDYYDRVNRYWLNTSHTSLDHVVLVSLYGGVRDILVRSGLSNINEWKQKSAATIISGYTVSMPFVWRSADHRCVCLKFHTCFHAGLSCVIQGAWSGVENL